MYIQYNNPNEVGMTGLLGMPSGYYSIHDSEVLLMLGTDFPYAPFMPDDNIIVQVDIKSDRLGRRGKIDMGLCGDVKNTIDALLPLIKERSDDSFLKKQLQLYDKVKDNLNTYVKEQGSDNNIHPEYVMSRIDSLASDDAIFTIDTGMTCVWGARYINATGKRKMLGSFNHGSMANALPQSIGASLAYPKQQVVALCGDGGLSMSLGDLATIVQYKLPIKIIVFNNRSLGMVKLEMQVMGLPDWQTDMLNPDFAKLSETMGIKGFTISVAETTEAILTEAFQTEGPVLVNIMTDPSALAMPPKITFKEMMGYSETLYKMMKGGRVKEIAGIIKSNYKHIKEIL